MPGDASNDALSRLAAAVPANVREVCATLTRAGHEAVTVGGAVRDAILGRTPGDWDVATSALPEQVLALFRRTIPTGLQHGTVTIVTGKGVESHVEVTTYRGEGAYTDARRPDSVTFGVPLRDDLARRDLRVNAMAYDPEHGRLFDPYGGQQDIADKLLRAVGPTGNVFDDAVARFTEDGLRVMRAVRFAAVLEYALDPDTERGIVPALPSLAKVSKERISDELDKLLQTRQPSRGLAIAHRTGILALIVPSLDHSRWGDGAVGRWLMRIDSATPRTRLAAFCLELGDPDTDPRYRDLETFERASVTLKALKFSNAEANAAAHLASIARAVELADLRPEEIRKLFSFIGRDHAEAAIELWRAHSPAHPAVIAEGERILREKHPLAPKDLAIAGKDLITELKLAPGPLVGRILGVLLDRVIADPTINTREQLLALAQTLELQLGAHGQP
ncbi:MAG: CCA tRNA nucleotidyltransferase [Kofleriaceae bacterium]